MGTLNSVQERLDYIIKHEAMDIINRYRSLKLQYLFRFFEDAGTFSVDHFTDNLLLSLM